MRKNPLVNEYLNDFVNGIEELLQTGIEVPHKAFEVNIFYFTSDDPA